MLDSSPNQGLPGHPPGLFSEINVLRANRDMATKKRPAKKSPKKPRAVARERKGKAEEPQAQPHPLMINGQSFDRALVMKHICDNLATSSKGVGSILLAGYEGHPLPTYTTIMQWLTEDAELADMYAHAKEAQADWMADELLRIADDEADDTLEVDGKQIKVKTAQSVNHARLRVDTRKWLAAKLKPRKYGERVTNEHTGPDNKPIQIADGTERVSRLAFLLGRGKSG